MGICVRQAELNDRPAIADFIKEAYQALSPYKGAERWNWQFCQNPYIDSVSGANKVPVWIALDGDRVVGQIAVQKGEVWLNGEPSNAGWIVDVMILPSHRGRKLGHLIHECCAKKEEMLFTLTMAPATRRIAEKAGCITLGPVRQYTRWQRLDAKTVHSYLLQRSLYHPNFHRGASLACSVLQVHRIVPILANPMLAIRDRLTFWEQSSPALTVEETQTFGEEFDSLWNCARQGYKAIFSRDSRFLRWRFVDCPQLKYHKFVARRGGEIQGYVILRRCQHDELPLGVIVDLFASRNDIECIEALLRFSILFFDTTVAALDCATSIPEIQQVLRRHGFFATRTMRPTVVCRDESTKSALSALRDSCYFSKGDHDWDQIHLLVD